MHLKKGCKLFVRVDFKTGENEMTGQDFENHLTYVKNIAKERYFLGGGFSNTDGGMCLFEAQNIEDAQKVAQNDPIIEKGLYRSEIYEWDLAVLSED
ncbi:MAG: YciI family protein [Oscillospiraceae bacterium]|nr:YciI family protein [Oscillospiraceae bacterium]